MYEYIIVVIVVAVTVANVATYFTKKQKQEVLKKDKI